MFEEDGVGAGPSAPESAEEGGDKEEGKAGAGDGEKEDPEILRVKSEAEEVELSLGDVEKDGGCFVDGEPGKGDVNDEEEEGENAAGQSETA